MKQKKMESERRNKNKREDERRYKRPERKHVENIIII